MKKIITRIRILYLCSFLLIATSMEAQYQTYPEIYPPVPFGLNQATDLGYMKCVVWKGTYKKASGDESGSIWSAPIVESHQYQRYIFPEGKMDMISTYFPNGDKQWTKEFFYKQGLLSGIEQLKYDSMQESSLDCAYAYFYQHDNVPFQRVKMFGYPNKNLRLLEEFVFDTLNRVVRQKATAIGQSPFMDSLVGMKDKEKILTLTEYTDSTYARRKYKNLYIILDDQKSFLNSEGNPAITEVRNKDGDILYTIDHKYEDGRVSKRLHWVMQEIAAPTVPKPEEAEEKKGKKKKSAKKGKKEAETIEVKVPMNPPIPQIYKIEYFTYSEEGLLEMKIIEENGTQIVYEYTYFSE